MSVLRVLRKWKERLWRLCLVLSVWDATCRGWGQLCCCPPFSAQRAALWRCGIKTYTYFFASYLWAFLGPDSNYFNICCLCFSSIDKPLPTSMIPLLALDCCSWPLKKELILSTNCLVMKPDFVHLQLHSLVLYSWWSTFRCYRGCEFELVRDGSFHREAAGRWQRAWLARCLLPAQPSWCSASRTWPRLGLETGLREGHSWACGSRCVLMSQLNLPEVNGWWAEMAGNRVCKSKGEAEDKFLQVCLSLAEKADLGKCCVWVTNFIKTSPGTLQNWMKFVSFLVQISRLMQEQVEWVNQGLSYCSRPSQGLHFISLYAALAASIR